jgi:hypothetical protein
MKTLWKEIATNVTKRMQFLLQLNPATTQSDAHPRQITRSISLSILTALPHGNATRYYSIIFFSFCLFV